MNHIQQFEQILGQEYGRIPREVKNTWLNRYVDYIKQKWYNPIDGVLGGLLIASIGNSDGFYRGKDHTIWTPNEINPFTEFAIFHELGHGYTRQRNKKYQEVDDLLAKEGFGSMIGGKFSKDTIEMAFLHRCVDEGIADYVAIQSQKRAVQEGTRNRGDVFCYEREWMLVNFEDPSPEQRFTQSTSLDPKMAAELEEMGNELINSFLDVNNAKGVDRLKKSIAAVKDFHHYAYVLGHYLVRATLNDRQEELGKDIDRLVMNPPRSIKEIQDITLSSF